MHSGQAAPDGHESAEADAAVEKLTLVNKSDKLDDADVSVRICKGR